ncbi:class I SAM-dependent methyltransferase [Hoeflea olei]|uniref:Methyltransferase domain-containing protein n=1 Tax=Hoeflea olei TaxID=1480615 RepID=A0A1C1YQC9_9HYPH|nr:class I SAM-dependent methyltransferase [Hoeflea olei]OCW55761.1 hypothetical protein AWJ14_14850 [Hoeflea olei]
MDTDSGARAERVLEGYAAAGADWIARSDGLDPERIYAPVLDFLPGMPATVLDLGAATGRDAAWLAGRGHQVTAVEPVAELRRAGQRLHPDCAIDWVDDRLPALERLGTRGFGLVLANGVLHHLDADAQGRALMRMAELTAPGGLAIAALRHGPAPADRPGWPVDVEALLAVAQAGGLALARRVDKGSIQPQNWAVGVTWTWLALARA